MIYFFKDMNLDSVCRDPKVYRFIKQAIPICLDIPRTKKHVSLIVRKGRLLAVGTNVFKGHPIASKIGYRFGEQHSELNAFLKCSQIDRLILINVRFNKDQQMRMARPCALCMPWCSALFEEIYYTCPDGIVRRLDNKVVAGHNSSTGLLMPGGVGS
jgi:hypothetical protein